MAPKVVKKLGFYFENESKGRLFLINSAHI